MRIINAVGLAATLSLVAGICRAERISRGAPGTAPCGDDKAVRVLAIGGELQANSWCGKKDIHKNNTGKTAEQERTAFKAAKGADLVTIVRRLLRRGANKTAQTKNGKAARMLAAMPEMISAFDGES